MKTVVRWPDRAAADSLVHANQLPDVDEQGRPVLPLSCRFLPRNSVDLLHPMLLRWKQGMPRQAAPSNMLVMDSTGRLAMHLQDEFCGCEILAVDDPPPFTGTTLKPHRERCHAPICHTKLDRRIPLLRFPNNSFDAVVLPFTLHRLCDQEEHRFLGLLREALRIARETVLVAEDVVSPVSDEAAFRRWKAVLQGEWSAQILLQGNLKDGSVPDHFLSKSGVSICDRRFLVIQVPTQTSASHGTG